MDYVAETLRLQGEGKYISMSYHDMIDKPQEPERSAQEIINDVVKNAGLEVRS